MNCPECEKPMLDEYEGVGNGKMFPYGNILSNEPPKERPVYYCGPCHLLIVDETEAKE
jgi:hypothetical protein